MIQIMDRALSSGKAPKGLPKSSHMWLRNSLGGPWVAVKRQESRGFHWVVEAGRQRYRTTPICACIWDKALMKVTNLRSWNLAEFFLWLNWDTTTVRHILHIPICLQIYQHESHPKSIISPRKNSLPTKTLSVVIFRARKRMLQVHNAGNICQCLFVKIL